MIVLVGFMGAGKTTVGRLLAAKLGLRFADSDQVIEQRRGRSVREIFAEDGEDAFRTAEREVLAGLMRGPEAVVAVGGGAVEQQASRRLLRAAQVIYLQVSYDEAIRRVGGDAGRPLLRRPDLDDVYRRRVPVYESVATMTVATAGRPAEAVCREVISRLATKPGIRSAPRASQRLRSHQNRTGFGRTKGLHHAHRDVAGLRGRLRADRGGAGRLRAGRPGHRLRARGVQL